MIQMRIVGDFEEGKKKERNLNQNVTLADAIQSDFHYISLRMLMQLHSTATERQNNGSFKAYLLLIPKTFDRHHTSTAKSKLES